MSHSCAVRSLYFTLGSGKGAKENWRAIPARGLERATEPHECAMTDPSRMKARQYGRLCIQWEFVETNKKNSTINIKIKLCNKLCSGEWCLTFLNTISRQHNCLLYTLL